MLAWNIEHFLAINFYIYTIYSTNNSSSATISIAVEGNVIWLSVRRFLRFLNEVFNFYPADSDRASSSAHPCARLQLLTHVTLTHLRTRSSLRALNDMVRSTAALTEITREVFSFQCRLQLVGFFLFSFFFFPSGKTHSLTGVQERMPDKHGPVVSPNVHYGEGLSPKQKAQFSSFVHTFWRKLTCLAEIPEAELD